MNNKKGFTLVEAIVSIAMLGIISVMIISAYMAQYRVISSNIQTKNKDKSAQSAVEKKISGNFNDDDINASSSEGIFEIDFNGTKIEVKGEYIKGTDEDGEFSYEYFLPEE